jgi:hypothetical protein
LTRPEKKLNSSSPRGVRGDLSRAWAMIKGQDRDREVGQEIDRDKDRDREIKIDREIDWARKSNRQK